MKLVEARLSKAKEAFAEADKEIVEPDRRATLEAIRNGLDTYTKGVPELSRLRTERDLEVSRMAQLGASMASDLEAVLDAASRSTSPSATAAAGYALANMQQGRSRRR